MNSPKRILVPAFGSPTDQLAIEYAAQFIKKSKAEVYLLYVVEVGRDKPLNAPMDADFALGERVLEPLVEIAERQGGRVHPEMLQARSPGAAIVGEALDRNVDMIVMGMSLRKKFGEWRVGDRELHVLLNAPCEVWIVRGPLSANEQPERG